MIVLFIGFIVAVSLPQLLKMGGHINILNKQIAKLTSETCITVTFHPRIFLLAKLNDMLNRNKEMEALQTSPP